MGAGARGNHGRGRPSDLQSSMDDPRPSAELYGCVPGLVRDAISGNVARAKRALDALLAQGNEVDYGPTFLALAQLLGVLSTSSPTSITTQRALMVFDLLLEHTDPLRRPDGRLPLLFPSHPEVARAAALIRKTPPAVEQSTRLRRRPLYVELLARARSVQAYGRLGISVLQLVPDSPRFQVWNEWNVELIDHLRSRRALASAEGRDQLVSLLMAEPDTHDVPGGQPRVLDETFADSSLGRFGALAPSQVLQRFEPFTAYLGEQLRRGTGEGRLLRGQVTAALCQLCFSQTVFFDLEQPWQLERQQFLMNLNTWQETFVTHLVLGAPRERDELIQAVLGAMPDYAVPWLLQSTLGWVIRPHWLDWRYDGTNGEHVLEAHTLAAYPDLHFLERHPENQRAFRDHDEFATECLMRELFPRLRKRLEHFDVIGRFETSLESLQQRVAAGLVEKLRLQELTTALELRREGEMAQEASADWEKAIERLWQEVMAHGGLVGVVPEDEVREVAYVPGSLGWGLGLARLRLQRAGSDPRWCMAFQLVPRLGTVTVCGEVAGGWLHLRLPLRPTEVELYGALSYLVVKTLHGLVMGDGK